MESVSDQLPKQHEDKSVDMQYARKGCQIAEFVANPISNCKDPISTYLSMRVEEREKFIGGLKCEEQDAIRDELGRIKQTRINFSSYENKKNMMEGLKRARQEWKEAVEKEHLGRRSSWSADDVFEDQTQPVNIEDYYGFKAYVMHFRREEGTGYIGYTQKHDKYIGTYPDQKISVHELLEEANNNPLTATPDENTLRYFHLPTNHMRWVEVSISDIVLQK